MAQFKKAGGGGDVFGIDIGLDPTSAGLVELFLYWYWPAIVGMIVTFVLVIMGNQRAFLIAGGVTLLLEWLWLEIGE